MTTATELRLGDTVHAFDRTRGDCMVATIVKPPVESQPRLCVLISAGLGARPTFLRHDPRLTKQHPSRVKPVGSGFGATWRKGDRMVADNVTQSWHTAQECPHGR